MSSQYAAQSAFASPYIPAMQRILGPLLVLPTPDFVDQHMAADFQTERQHIAARIRRHGYLPKFRFDFTMRTQVASGRETEIDKVLAGYADVMLYAHAERTGYGIHLWSLLDMDMFRRTVHLAGNWRHYACARANGDGTMFAAFDLRAFPRILIARGFGNHPAHYTRED